MFVALSSILAIALSAPAYGQGQDFGLVSPCPRVFTYEPLGAEPGKWYGNIELATDTNLYALWLNIVVDSKADLLGNWIGEVTTDNNLDFRIENTNIKITPEASLAFRFFIQYNTQNKPPKLLNIRFNGREICKVENTVTTTTIKPVVPPRVTERSTNKTQNWQAKVVQTTQKPVYWIQPTTANNNITAKPSLWPQAFAQVANDSKNQTALEKTLAQIWPNNNQQVKPVGTQQKQIVTESKPTQEVTYWPKVTATETPKRATSKFVIDDDSIEDHSTRGRPIYQRPTNKNPANSRERQPESTYIVEPVRSQEDDIKFVGKWGMEQPSLWSEGSQGSQTNNGRVIFESAGDRSTKFGDQVGVGRANKPTFRYQATTIAPAPVTAVVSDIEDFDSVSASDAKKENDFMYHIGGLPTIFIPAHAASSEQPNCGKVLLNKADIERRTSSVEGQWPWQIALYQQQTTVDFKYICGGTLVSRRHVITAAHCVCRQGTRKVVNKNTLTVYLGKSNLRTSVTGVEVKFVNKITVHPAYNATTYTRNAAILQLRESVTYSAWVQPACLWPETDVDLNNIIGEKGSVVGWGFEASGAAREELNLLEMPIVNQETCIGSHRELYRRYTSSYTYCAGYGASSCNGDSGGGMVFKRGDSWYLRGLVSLSISRRNDGRCDQDHYVIFTDLAKMLPWIEENLDDY